MAELYRTSRAERDPIDVAMAEQIKAWMRTKDPRPSHGAIVLVTYEDGFSVHWLGSEPIDEAELVRRVIYIAGEMREAAGPDLGYYR